MRLDKCVASCPGLILDGTCLNCSDVYDDYPYWDQKEKRCKSCAEVFPGEKEWWDRNTGECVDKCATEDGDDSKCPSCT